MKNLGVYQQTFRSGSTTYYNSSVFFPKGVREDVFKLYAFVRAADNFVDQIPQDSEGFHGLEDRYQTALTGYHTGDVIVDSFVELACRRGFERSWTDAFLHSMALDLSKKTYQTMEETLEYIYGSAEVIGLFMSRLLGLNEEALHFAQMQGRAMQYINFIRDVAEDQTLGRTYLPLEGSGLASISEGAARTAPQAFEAFIRDQICIFKGWQAEAEEGYALIPRRFRIPIKTASQMYVWTAAKIERNPFVVYERKVKPRKSRIILQGLKNALELW